MKRIMLTTAALGALLVAGPALAADLSMPMPYKSPAYAPVPYFTWTGCYLGGHVGGGWGRKDFSDAAGTNFIGTTVQDDTGGFLGGGQIGCNYQFATSVVLGIEADASWADISGDSPNPLIPGDSVHARTDLLTDVTGRLGWTWNRWLVYAKGGVAWAHDNYDVLTPGADFSASETRTGWTVGAGVEWAFLDNWSAKLEYLHYDFGGRDLTLTDPVAGTIGTHIDQRIDTVKLGLNYRFWAGPASIVARY
jgi:outer membrane immunogenic protein